MSSHLKSCALVALGLAATAARAEARQARGEADSARRNRGFLETPALLSDLEERQRLAQLLDDASTDGAIVRSLSSRLELPSARRPFVRMLAPDLRVVVNTHLPFSLNDGALWAGRGRNSVTRAGVLASIGPVRVLVAPELVYSENEAFQDVKTPEWYRPPLDTTFRSPYSSPWHVPPFSADVPFRPGDRPSTRVVPGQSAIWISARGVEAGVSTENQWWGPGVHDALILTNSGPGFRHGFVRTARPIETRFGRVEGRWLVGSLRESAYFDTTTANDRRSLAAATVTLSPRWEPHLTIGLARAVFAGAPRGTRQVMARWLDVLQPTTRPNARSWADTTHTGGRDQLTSLFARWVFPAAHTEVYGEVGRAEWPASLRDLLVDPTHTMAYLLGTQSAGRFGASRLAWRLQAELAFLERSNSYRYRPTQSWYTSRATPQGYMHEGQPLGAGIGTGSSHQWLAWDAIAPAWRVGVFGARWRYNADWNGANDGFPLGTGSCEYDVTLYWGVRGGVRSRLGVATAEAQFGDRYNYLYQNNSGCPRGAHMKDVRSASVRVGVTPLRFW